MFIIKKNDESIHILNHFEIFDFNLSCITISIGKIFYFSLTNKIN